MNLTDWQAYLPVYRFPQWLRSCFGCFGVLLVIAGLLIFLILPSIFVYINSLDTKPVVDGSVGSLIDLGRYQLNILAIENDTRCAGDSICNPSGSVTIRVRSTFDDSEYTIKYLEDNDFSDAISLPLGYLIRVISISPDSESPQQPYKVRFQIFQPPED